MNQLNYRVWDNELKKWCADEIQYIRPDGAFITGNFENHGGALLTPDLRVNYFHGDNPRFTISFNTGLRDYGKEEIYDGDIVFDQISEERGGVYFEEGAYWVVHENVVELLCEMCNHLEILGNKFEDAELLEGRESQ